MKCPIFDIDPINSTTCSFCSAYCEHRQKPEMIVTTNTLQIMTHEQFITLETARLAKQAGFNWECETCYIGKSKTPYKYDKYFNWNMPRKDFEKEGSDNLFYAFINQKKITNFISAPTQSVLQRWLREIKGISVEVYHEIVWVEGGTLGIKWTYSVCHLNSNESDIPPSDEFDTFEAALEAGLQKCLTLLIEKQ